MKNHDAGICLRNVGLALLLCLSCGLVPVLAQEPGDARIGEAVDPDEGERVAEPRFREGTDSAVVPDHPPIDSIEARPMPRPDERRTGSDDPGEALFHDAETGETLAFPAEELSRAIGAQGGGFRGIASSGSEGDSDSGKRGFGSKSLTSDGALQSYPRSPNVKLFLRFVDTDGNNVFSHCSGTMLDSGVVLTAGHCIHAANDSDIDDWAEEAWVYPAWDGDGSLNPASTAHRDFWGWARGTQFFAFTGWYEDANFDWDAGLIRLRRTGEGNRQVGMLTGWYGWAQGGDCSWIQDQTYHNFSYPAQNCPTSGLHNGRDMYYWNGSIDDCPSGGRQMEIDTGSGCMTAMWGGESGSSAYYIDNDSRFAHGVASTSDRSSVGRYAKLWEAFIDFFRDEVRPDTRRDTVDWELLRFRTDDTRLVPGGQTESSTVEVANATNDDPPGEQFTLRVYLSDNNNVTSSDTLLATFTYNVDFADMEMRTFNVPSVNIPEGLSPGTYWLGATIDVGGDLFAANNNVWGWDAHEVEVFSQDVFRDRFEF